ncbi:MAG: hypothetical protein ACI4NM_00490 [Bullifex sp.]
MKKRMALMMIILACSSFLFAGGAFNVDAGYTFSNGKVNETGEKVSSMGIMLDLSGKGFLSPSFSLGGGVFVHIPVTETVGGITSNPVSVRIAPNIQAGFRIGLMKALYFDPSAGFAYLFSLSRTAETFIFHSEADLTLELTLTASIHEVAAFRLGVKGYIPLWSGNSVKNLSDGSYSYAPDGRTLFHITPFLGVSIII